MKKLRGMFEDFARSLGSEISDLVGFDDIEINYSSGKTELLNNTYAIFVDYVVHNTSFGSSDTFSQEDTEQLKKIFDSMNSYTVSTKDKTVDDGNGGTKTIKVKVVDVINKTDDDVKNDKSLDKDQLSLVNAYYEKGNKEMFEVEYNKIKSKTVSADDKTKLLSAILDDQTKKAVSYALDRVGYMYSTADRHSGFAYDCSSLAYYAWLDAGIDISYDGATTEGYEAKGLEGAGCSVEFDAILPGDLLFYNFDDNDNYKSIGHVVIYVGDGKVVEAADTERGVIVSDVYTNGFVMAARPTLKNKN